MICNKAIGHARLENGYRLALSPVKSVSDLINFYFKMGHFKILQSKLPI